MFVILNKKLVPANKAKISAFDRGFKFGDAIYETLRTVNGKPWLLAEHLKRLRSSAKILQMNVPPTNAELTNQITRIIKKNGYKESRIRITISRDQTVLVETTKLTKPRNLAKGVEAITYRAERTFPKAKSTNMLPSIIARREAEKKKAYEALLVDRHNNITEGAFSNVFAVRNGQLITPKEGILEGTIRNYILSVYPKVRLAPIPLNKIHTYDEIFVTSSTFGAVPIVKVDGRPIKNGTIGRITQNIIKLLSL
jgi:branched-chain amino acid aminotransferase